ncbi:MAG: glycosyltransferase [Phycisphaeraceae bacterium]|nr:glycosyltransferase [Phycisphaeraceae bacterium]
MSNSKNTSKSPPLVTIVTPTYNQAETLKQTLESVLSQDYPHVQYIVIDGDSTDATCDILKQYDGQLEWISEKDNGQTDAIAKGFAKAQGQIIAWLNSDDMYTPQAISKAVEALTKNPQTDLVYGDVNWLTHDGRLIAKCVSTEPFNRHRLLHVSNFICQPTTFFNRSAYEAVGGVDLDQNYVMDYDLWLKLTREKPALFLPVTLAQVRCYAQTKTASGGQQRIQEMKSMIATHGGNGLPAFYRIESASQLFTQALQDLKKMNLVSVFKLACHAFGQLMHHRVIRTIFSKQFFQIIKVRKLRSES